MQHGWSRKNLAADEAWAARREWFDNARIEQYLTESQPSTWLVMGGRGAGKSRLGAEWVNCLVRGWRPFADDRYATIALVGETLGDVREVMIDGVSGIVSIARQDRPRFEASRRRLVWDNGAVAQMFSSEDPESLRGPQFSAAWCDELGCPAIDKGANQPNVFPDAKSVENAAPYFSDGGRSDDVMRSFLQAHFQRWDEDGDDFDGEDNPLSPVYGGRMVDASRIYAWAWDARPFPSFPQRADRWADGGNWQRGHWLNGRLGNPATGELINSILADCGEQPAVTSSVRGSVQGYLVSDPSTARGALEPVIDLFDLSAFERNGQLVVQANAHASSKPLSSELIVNDAEESRFEAIRNPDHDMATEGVLSFRDLFTDYQSASARVIEAEAAGLRQHAIGFPGALEPGQAKGLLTDWLRRQRSSREQIAFSVALDGSGLDAGDVVQLDEAGAVGDYIITSVDRGIVARIAARRLVRTAPTPWMPDRLAAGRPTPPVAGQPLAIFLDLPMAGDTTPETRFRVAAWRRPWKTQAVYASPSSNGYEQRASIAQAAIVGRLEAALLPGPVGRIDRSGEILVHLVGGELAGVDDLHFLNGSNAAAVRSAVGAWEIVQFRDAEEVEPDQWRLTGLLRGQLGSDDATAAGAAEGADFVLLDQGVIAAGLSAGEMGLSLNWRVGAAGADFSSTNFMTSTEIGGVRARLPLSPVHIRGRKNESGDILISWKRRSRVMADDWEAADVPLGEDVEQYQVEVSPVGGDAVRMAVAGTQQWTYPAAAIAADFGSAPAEMNVTVRQRSATVGWGLPRTRRIEFATT